LTTLSWGKSCGRLLQVVQRRAAPAVDGLVVIAHGGKAAAFSHQQLEHLVLRGVGVLVLVDQHMAQLLPANWRAPPETPRSSLSGRPIRSSKVDALVGTSAAPRNAAMMSAVMRSLVVFCLRQGPARH
jgi:hypothetical protein